MWSLSRLPHSHADAVASARRDWAAVVEESTPVWPFMLGGEASVIALARDRIVYLNGIGSRDVEAPYQAITVEQDGSTVVLSGPGLGVQLEAMSPDAATQFARAIDARQNIHGRPGPRPKSAVDRVLIVTTNDVPGHNIVTVHGDVFGLVVRARNMFSNMGASLRTVVGGEVHGYTKLLSESRNDARERLAAEALQRGANAVVAMRFDCNEIADVMSEVAAYGTAVTIERSRRPGDD